jgi:hypothetical protein
MKLLDMFGEKKTGYGKREREEDAAGQYLCCCTRTVAA